MILTYKDCMEKYKTPYMLDKAVSVGELFKIESGIYSDKPYEPEIAVISKKYPNAIFTLNSAFYYYNLTDTIPEKYYLATEKSAYPIPDKRIVQKFENSAAFNLGVTTINQEGVLIKIYNRERLLLELIRNRNTFSFDYYKEILNNYRNIVHNLNIQDIQDYAEELPKNKMIMNVLRLEVF